MVSDRRHLYWQLGFGCELYHSFYFAMKFFTDQCNNARNLLILRRWHEREGKLGRGHTDERWYEGEMKLGRGHTDERWHEGEGKLGRGHTDERWHGGEGKLGRGHTDERWHEGEGKLGRVLHVVRTRNVRVWLGPTPWLIMLHFWGFGPTLNAIIYISLISLFTVVAFSQTLLCTK